MTAQSSFPQNRQNDFITNFVNRTWTTSDGLPGNNITDMIQAKNGYLYFGTYVGLVRFDGMDFQVMNRNKDPKYDFVSARILYQDSKGNIWSGSNDEGVACISPNGNVIMYTTKDGLPNNSIRAITEDLNGNIWIGTASGVSYITPQWDLVHPKGLEEYDESNILVQTIYCDTAGRIWLSSLKPGSIYTYTDGTFSKYKGITSFDEPIVDCIMQDSLGTFWFGIAPHYAIKIDGNSETVYDIGYGVQSGTIINCIYQDSTGTYWFAMDNGIAILHNGEVTFYDHEGGLSDNNVNVILEDRENNIWIGTDRGGVEKLTLSKFRTVHTNSAINAIADDPVHQTVWLGSDTGLLCYDYKTSHFIENQLTRFCTDVRIRHVELTNDNTILVSTYNKLGQVEFTITGGTSPDTLTGTIRTWTPEDGLAGYKVRLATKISNGDLYIGTTVGLSIVDHATGAIQTLHMDDGLPNEYIMCLYENDDGTVWGGTDGGGVFVLKNGKVIQTYSTDTGLIGNVIFKIHKLEDNAIWITTGTGISRIAEDGSICNFNSTSGLGIDAVFQILTDYTGRAWFTSNQGITATSFAELKQYAQGEITHFSTKLFGQSDGLRTGGVTATSLSMKDQVGRLWFTLSDGFAIYDPVKVTNSALPYAVLQAVYVDNDQQDFSDSNIIIPPSGKRIRIQFSSLSFTAPEQIQFRYQLKGFEKEFSAWTNQREVSYTNLIPGTYEFIVQSQNTDGITSAHSNGLVIIKKPYIWQIWWCWLIFILIIVAIVALILWHRYQQMLRYQDKLEKEVAAQTVKLQNQAERLVQANIDLTEAKEKVENLLLNILPQPIAVELSEHPDKQIAKQYANACVLFADLVGFTKLSDSMSAENVVSLLNSLFTLFDNTLDGTGIEKIKTIGDSYMAATGLTEDIQDNAASQMLHFAQKMLQIVDQFNKDNNLQLQLRIGVNSGNLVGGVIGKKKFIYDIWGDTVNVASRMESTGIPGRIHVTEYTWKQTKDTFAYDAPIEIEVKGKGRMKTYFLSEEQE
ncbi:MAG: hypothetical protein K6E51_06765 [Treponema sp.]|nr:hypothetical protein [Treponema sp.]